jgi:hypothetical protein
MGLYDSILAELTCPHCGNTGEMEVQTKIDPSMETYHIGDRVDWQGIVTIIFEDDAECDACTARINRAEKAIEARLRKQFAVPDEVDDESWEAWPDGTPVLCATRLHAAYQAGLLPTFEEYCADRGADPDIGGTEGGNLCVAYWEEVRNPYLVKIQAPYWGLATSHPAFKAVVWRDLLQEALDRLRAEGELPVSRSFPVIVEVIDHLLTSVRVR